MRVAGFAVEAPFGQHTGVLHVASSLVRALDVLGKQPLAIATEHGDGGFRPAWLRDALRRTRMVRRHCGSVHAERCLRYHGYARPLQTRARRHEALVYWDSDTMPPEVARTLARFDVVYGVSRFVADVVRESTGIAACVLPHGIWPEDCPLHAPPCDGPTTLLHMGQVCRRKGTDALFRAFRAAFPVGNEDVRLVVKTWPEHADTAKAWKRDIGGSDDRIVLDPERVARPNLSAYFTSCHAVVLPSRCEGFGMVGLEALAHGRPLIATAWSGPVDYLAAGCIALEATKRVPAEGYPGHAREPDFEHLVHALRTAHAERERLAAEAAAGRGAIHQRWSWPALVERHWLDGEQAARAA